MSEDAVVATENHEAGQGRVGAAPLDLAGFGGEAGSVGYDIGAIYYWYSEEGEAGAGQGCKP